MAENRERSNSTHEAYLKRIAIPPIMIPPHTPLQQPQQAPQPQQASQPQKQHHISRGPMQSPRALYQVSQQVSHRVIPRVERRPARLPPSNDNLPTGAKGCLCGCIKITGGYLACPLLCPLSCMAGACRGIYHAVTCDKYNDGTDPNNFCMWWGCYNACIISSTWIEDGVADMRRTPRVETEMVR